MEIFNSIDRHLVEMIGILTVLVGIVFLSCIMQAGFMASTLERSTVKLGKEKVKRKRFWHRQKKIHLEEGDEKELTD